MNAPAANPSILPMRAEDNRAASLDHCHTNFHLSASRDIPNPLHGRETANDINAPVFFHLRFISSTRREVSLSLSLFLPSSSWQSDWMRVIIVLVVIVGFPFVPRLFHSYCPSPFLSLSSRVFLGDEKVKRPEGRREGGRERSDCEGKPEPCKFI